MNRPSRREILGAGGFTLLAVAAAAAIAKPDDQCPLTMRTLGEPQYPDGELIALSNRFMTLQAQADEINAGKPCTDKDLADLVTEQAAIMDEINEHTVTTLDGHRARARVLAAWYQLRGMDDCPFEIAADRIWPLLRDLLGASV